MSTEDASEVPDAELEHQGDDLIVQEGTEIRLMRTEGSEVLLIENARHESERIGFDVEDLELATFKQQSIDDLKMQQEQRCSMCGEAAINHRIEIKDNDDKRRLGIPDVPANGNLRFLYRCCVGGCPFQSIRHLRHARAFNFHIDKHDKVLKHVLRVI